MSVSNELVQWLASGERGLSSNQMVEHLTGMPAVGKSWGRYRPHYPIDPDDLRRCRLLLEQVPLLALRLPQMATCSAVWAALVDHWDELCQTMDAECPKWRDRGGSAPRTFKRMQELTRGLDPKEIRLSPTLSIRMP